jgi:hypothetical protein
VAEKLDDGAFATFLGLTVGSDHWQAVATGDTCLFVVRDDGLRKAFPVQAASAFGNRPDLIGSRQKGRVRAATIREAPAAGDRLLMMTDALAEWFLAAHEAGARPWQELAGRTADDFPAWVADRRAAGTLKNDDVSLVVIDMGGSDAPDPAPDGRTAR